MVSVGVSLIILSFLVPWLLIREPFDLLQKQVDINSLTTVGKAIIQIRQLIIAGATVISPCISVLLLCLGLGIFIKGSVLWYSNTQKVIDATMDADLGLKQSQLKSLTENQREKELESDAIVDLENSSKITADDERPILEQIDSRDVGNFVSSAFKVENQLISLMTTCFSSNFDVLANQRMSDVNFDTILRAKDRFTKDRVIEIKYVRRGFKYGWLRDNALKIFYANKIYQKEQNRIPIPILIVVSSKQILESPDKLEYMKRIKEELSVQKIRTRIVFINEEDLDNLSCERLLEKLDIYI